ncbi:type VI secretion system membrane subunit TssM [Salinisphaera sp. Q1T1-3]|uniref:type VI secretion system membrane subunit TssM n=1 Tax=Salinisphaera sp. Q1T1-3 TaxID=2321229 RepID=UPI000E75F380|nr:type VI secretion system membrane subunit TssM [Salinisphaera sp. Q1T1-3]
MTRFKAFITDRRTLIAIGLIALLLFVLLVADTWRTALLLIETLVLLGFAIWGGLWLWRRRQGNKGGDRMSDMLNEQAADNAGEADDSRRAEIAELRDGMREAVRTIKSSKIGHTSGRAALYELPWYMIIGNPAAGKSTAILNSGLQFPLEDEPGRGRAIRGIGGTRNCDWFFTTEGILLDTAGRFSVHSEDRVEWLGFLDLLKKNRPKAPLNGILIACSVADLTERGPEFAIDLAKQLRQRVQEITERLEIFAPVYVVFTKADLVSGFSEFFAEADAAERSRVWGATMRYDIQGNEAAVASFDERFDELHRGLQEMSLAQMSMRRGQKMPPGVFTFPLEFAAIKPAARALIATLFEENPYQFNPVFRGFYLTSALQEGQPIERSGAEIARRFGLSDSEEPARVGEGVSGFFISDLFRRVVFADSGLVRQYNSPTKIRTRYALFFASVAVLGLLFAGWTWSYSRNRALLADVSQDMQQAVAIQNNQVDLESRFDALTILQKRIQQLEGYQADQPLTLSLGLYQGDAMLAKLKQEYYHGLQTLMLQPVKQNLETFLAKVNNNAGDLKRSTPAAAAQETDESAGTYEQADPTDVKDAYNALKTYLMLADKSHVDVKHLYDQLTRFWRGWLESNRGGMPREKMIRDAEQVISFYLAHVNDASWPLIQDKLTLVSETRQHLRQVMAGLPAEQRVYAEIKARASTRFPPVTVESMLNRNAEANQDSDTAGAGQSGDGAIQGSYAVSGTFSRQAWNEYIKGAIKKAATEELQTDDWVLRSSQSDDLTLQGSPKQIEQHLLGQYKQEYAAEWRKFIQGLTVADFSDFRDALAQMETLGNPESSPIRRILTGIYLQTSWDNPSQAKQQAESKMQDSGIVAWFKRVILRRTPHQVNRAAYYVDTDQIQAVAHDGNGNKNQPVQGELAAHFSGIAQLVRQNDGDSILTGYLKSLGDVRTALNQIQNQGQTGPGAAKLMRDTLNGDGSALGQSLQYVEQQMLPALPDQQREVVRPILVRPLVQTFAALVEPTEREINRQWQASVYKPYRQTLAGKYPFAPKASVEAANNEIAQIFGPDGSIARFADDNLKGLVIQRGDTITPRTWADIGVSLTPAFTQHFPQWVSSLGSQGMPTSPENKSGQPRTVFQIQPTPAPGAREYTIVLDGQKLTYRNTPPQWSNFIWPNPSGDPGVSISATTFDGRTVQLIDFPGHYGLRKLVQSAAREREGDNVFKLSWSEGNLTVSVNLRIISNPASDKQNAGVAALHLPSNIMGADATHGAIDADAGTASSEASTAPTQQTGADNSPQPSPDSSDTSEEGAAQITNGQAS